MKCTEAWLREGVAKGEFPHTTWGKGKIIFTAAHLKQIAHLREVPVHPEAIAARRVIGTRARRNIS